MKPPKEPRSFKWPRMYVRFGHSADYCRLRIIEPNGRSTWFGSLDGEEYMASPCWHRDYMNAKQAVEAMKKYDQKYSIETIFIGEIK